MSSSVLNSIMLVDDDEVSNLFNKIFIAKLNLEVEVDIALNGKKALDLLNSSSLVTPSLLLLDIRMPEMDGWEFLEAYDKQVSSEIRDEITIVMLTTSADEGDMVRALNTKSVKEFIQKPLSERAIRRLIGKYFSNAQIDSES